MAVYWPATPTLENYAVLLEVTNFLTYMRNSAIVATSTMLLTIFVSVLAAYSFARYRFPGRRMMISGLLLIYMVPSVVLVVPLLNYLQEPPTPEHVWRAHPGRIDRYGSVRRLAVDKLLRGSSKRA